MTDDLPKEEDTTGPVEEEATEPSADAEPELTEPETDESKDDDSA